MFDTQNDLPTRAQCKQAHWNEDIYDGEAHLKAVSAALADLWFLEAHLYSKQR
jgi:hypothetical protein